MFLNDKHISNFQELCSLRFQRTGTEDPYYASAFFLLAIPGIFEKSKAAVDSDGIDFSKILNSPLSGGEYFMARTAFNLFSDGGERQFIENELGVLDQGSKDQVYRYLGVDISDVLRLDDAFFNAFIQAIKIRARKVEF